MKPGMVIRYFQCRVCRSGSHDDCDGDMIVETWTAPTTTGDGMFVADSWTSQVEPCGCWCRNRLESSP